MYVFNEKGPLVLSTEWQARKHLPDLNSTKTTIFGKQSKNCCLFWQRIERSQFF